MFTIQVFISFFVGGLFIALQTFFGERVPLRWRGVVLTIPTTLALGLFFIGLTKTPVDVAQAVTIIPAALGPDYLFVLSFAFFSQFNLMAGFVASFSVWIVSSGLLLYFPPVDLITSILFYGAPSVLIAYLLVSQLQQTTTIIPVPMTWKRITVRSLIGGSVVALIVILSKTLGNNWGGLFSTFPAAFSATFLIYYFVHGKKIIPSVAKSLFFPGAIGFTLYAVIAGLTIPKFGIWAGTLISYIVTIPFYYFYTQLRIKLTQAE